MKDMCDAIHAMGMKVGIYSTPWMGTYAGFIGGSAPNAKSDYGEMAIPEKERKQEDQILEVTRAFIAERRTMWEPSGYLTVMLNNGRIGGSIM